MILNSVFKILITVFRKIKYTFTWELYLPRKERERQRKAFEETFIIPREEWTEEQEIMRFSQLDPTRAEFRNWDLETPIGHRLQIIILVSVIVLTIIFGFKIIFFTFAIFCIVIGIFIMFFSLYELRTCHKDRYYKRKDVFGIIYAIIYITTGTIFFTNKQPLWLLMFFSPLIIHFIDKKILGNGKN
ncbi:hypothetical protein EMN47_20305 [Prolixibacteraceae bacterium JC049]|nr:hypothetical protein [Prolixibacteraceae bacterium JC049]